ncbi:ABC transporter ATP-binding protein [candidate division WOR-3 bacterium]|nr:ABC transporter ATP-binding protein [candidate division WOR-3 bacterium]
MKNFKTLKEYFIKYKWRYIGGLFALVIVNVLQLFIPRIIKYAIDDITQGGVVRAHLIKYALWIVGLALVVTFFRFFWRYFIAGVAIRIQEALRNRLFSHLQILGLKFFRDHRIGDLMAHFTNDMNAVRRTLGFGTVMIVDISVLGSLSFVFMLFISVKLTLYAIIPLPLITLVALRFAKLIHKRFGNVQASFSELTASARESIEGIRVMRAYNQQEGELDKFKEQTQEYVDKNISLLRVWSGFFPLIFFLANLTICIVLWFGGKETILKTISLGDFVAFQAYLGTLVWPIMAIGIVINLLQRGAASMGRINKLLDTVPEIVDSKQKTGDREEINGEIEFRGVSFAYNGTEVLKDINLSVKPGESLGIAGPVGSGKSTLVSLISRLFDPTNGEIRMDGTPIKEIPLSTLRKSIGFVPQDSFLFSDTIRANIGFGRSEVSDSEIYRVAKLARIYDEIMQLPNKFDEIVGERGVTLSGGQCQRLAIARAILVNPKILVIDNALSSVDIEKEREILNDLQKKFADRVLIIISHRIRSLAGLNHIIVLEQGEIKESGTHEELLSLRGVYFNLFRYQELE